MKAIDSDDIKGLRDMPASDLAAAIDPTIQPWQKQMIDTLTANGKKAVELRCNCGRSVPEGRQECCKGCKLHLIDPFRKGEPKPIPHYNSCNRRLREELRASREHGTYLTLLKTGRAVRYRHIQRRNSARQVIETLYHLDIERSNGFVITLAYPSRDAAMRARTNLSLQLHKARNAQQYDAFIDRVSAAVKERLALDEDGKPKPKEENL